MFAGIAAGTTTVGVLTGRTERADFEKAGAAFVVRDIRDVTALIG
ncbi:MAG: HAD hydrolase-like protein [Syntrophorhabdales bacterium]